MHWSYQLVTNFLHRYGALNDEDNGYYDVRYSDILGAKLKDECWQIGKYLVARRHRRTFIASSTIDNTALICYRPPRHCVNHTPRQFLRNALSDAQLLLFGTHCRKQSLI